MRHGEDAQLATRERLTRGRRVESWSWSQTKPHANPPGAFLLVTFELYCCVRRDHDVAMRCNEHSLFAISGERIRES
jgi:hypothetical protein